MSQLVAYFDEKPVSVRGSLEIEQAPISTATQLHASDGVVQTKVVYVRVPHPSSSMLVPFGAYDDWSLRDRYNEAIRIMNTLGAATITCETYGEAAVRRGLRARYSQSSAEVTQRRIKNSGFDYRHVGAGSAPRDPRPLRWPDEPGFAAAVSSVLENGATEVEINIKSNRTHSVDGSLGVELKKLGFNLGGMTEHSDATALSISATFPQNRRGWK